MLKKIFCEESRGKGANFCGAIGKQKMGQIVECDASPSSKAQKNEKSRNELD